MSQQITLSDEKFQEIYTDDRFLHDCAFPVDCCDARGFHKFYRTCTYPIEYIITEEQIAVAKVEFARRKQAFIDNYKKGTLVLVCMGGVYQSIFPDGIGNHRVRGDFKNSKGHHYFIEFCRGISKLVENFHCTFSVDMEMEDDGMRNYNIFDLQRRNFGDMPFTKSALLEIVNSTFGCNYRELVLAEWLISTDDIISEC